MKLYFAFSNIILLNQANIQVNNSKEEGDLLVWSTSPIDCNIVNEIIEKEIFNNVWYLERPKIAIGSKLNRFKSERLKQQFYNRYLDKILVNKVYDEFIVAGFWNDSLHIIEYLKKYNPNIKIGICEEGLLNYYCGYNHENLYYMVQYGKKERLKAWILGGKSFKDIQKRIVADYLIAPDFVHFDLNNEIFRIPSIGSNKIMQELTENIAKNYLENLYREYRERNIYYIASQWSPSYDPVDISPEILSFIEEVVPPEKLIIKTHSNATNHRKTYAENVDKNVFVDRNVYLFEIMCSRLDLSDKVFIIRNSSIALYLTQLFEKEPVFIFTHRLFSRYHYGLDDCGDHYVKDLKRHVKNPERIFVPDSLSDFKRILTDMSNKYCGGIKKKELGEDNVEEMEIKSTLLLMKQILEQKYNVEDIDD